MGARSPRHKVRTFVAIGAVIVVIGVGATAAFATTRGSSHAYRTAVVTRGAVARELRSSGTIQPVAQASVAFPVAGTVATVDVVVGAHVTVGQQLATLDASSYQQAVIEKQAQLAATKLTLYKALNGESTSGSSSARGASNANVNTTAAVSTSAAANNSTAGVQQQLLVAQQKVDAALAAVQTTLASANTACATSSTTTPTTKPNHGSKPPSGVKPTSGSQPALATTTSTTSTTVPSATKPVTSGLGSAACIAAQQQLFTDQQTLAGAQQDLARAEQAFERALSSSSSSPNANANGSAPTASAPSAAQLIADQTAVDAAATAVLAAQESVEQATVTSPLDGTVAAVSMQVGHTVTASSTTDTVVIVGNGGYEVSTTVGVNDIAKLKIGDAATVVPDATSKPLAGKVVWIGSASGSGSSTTYSVVIGLPGSPAGLRNGAMASTSIELARSTTSALTVPTSAVHTTNTIHLVTVLAAGKTSTVPVQIGVVGAEKTQVTSGLQAGQVVVLADLHAAVPSSNTSSRIANAITGGSGGTFGGGGSFVRQP